ncbi:MAG: TraR/DksA C4-type zinc finger protein [Bdellovibrionia bacterium]
MERRNRVAQQLIDLNEDVKPPSATDEMFPAQPADAVDLGQESADHERIYATAQMEQRQLEAIDAALGRIEHGNYGTCEECGSSISERRLELVPETTMCMECKRAAEVESAARRKGP